MARQGMREYVEQLEREGDFVAVAQATSPPAAGPTPQPKRRGLLGVLALCLPMLAAAASAIPATGSRLAGGAASEPTCELARDVIESEARSEQAELAKREATAVLRATRRQATSRT